VVNYDRREDDERSDESSNGTTDLPRSSDSDALRSSDSDHSSPPLPLDKPPHKSPRYFSPIHRVNYLHQSSLKCLISEPPGPSLQILVVEGSFLISSFDFDSSFPRFYSEQTATPTTPLSEGDLQRWHRRRDASRRFGLQGLVSIRRDPDGSHDEWRGESFLILCSLRLCSCD
jgi:hypothetical protein